MDNASNFSGEDHLGFKQIVLNYLRKIMDLNLKVINPDLAIEYVHTYKNSVLGLSDVLLPFYDSQMNKAYSKYEVDIEDVKKQTTNNGIIINDNKYRILCKEVHRNLFRELNLLLKRNDYLKENVYGENTSEEVVEDTGGEE